MGSELSGRDLGWAQCHCSDPGFPPTTVLRANQKEKQLGVKLNPIGDVAAGPPLSFSGLLRRVQHQQVPILTATRVTTE